MKSVQCFALCGYCDVCTGYFPTKNFVLDTGAENQLCPTGAIARRFIEEKGGERFFEYTIDESLCIGCGKCVARLPADERLALLAGSPRPLRQLQRVLDRGRLPDAGRWPRAHRLAQSAEPGRPVRLGGPGPQTYSRRGQSHFRRRKIGTVPRRAKTGDARS